MAAAKKTYDQLYFEQILNKADISGCNVSAEEIAELYRLANEYDDYAIEEINIESPQKTGLTQKLIRLLKWPLSRLERQ